MSATNIKDGSSGNIAKVDGELRLRTFATTENVEEHAITKAVGWNINTLDITLTSDSPSVTQYIKNTGATTLLVKRFAVIAGYSANGLATDQILIEVIRNPSSTTASTSFSALNSNFGSNKEPEATILTGQEAATATGGDGVPISSRMDPGGRNILPTFVSLPQGTCLAIRITPPSGNTSMTVQTVTVLFEEE